MMQNKQQKITFTKHRVTSDLLPLSQTKIAPNNQRKIKVREKKQHRKSTRDTIY